MPSKSFLVKVELTIQKISCPGVWLCTNGKVSLQLCMLDSNIQTEVYKPNFPIAFNERSLTKQLFIAELIQWKNCDEGVVLARFQTTLDDLLYPNAFKSSNLVGTNVDLLMEPTKLFPGTISPKLELRTKTTIEETFSDASQQYSDKISSKQSKQMCSVNQSTPKKLHPKRVCHTIAYSKAQQRCCNAKKDKRPIFKYQKPEDDLILRTNPNKVVKDDIIRKTSETDENNSCLSARKTKSKFSYSCYCADSAPISHQVDTQTSFVKSVKSDEVKSKPCPCFCGKPHEPYICLICSKYECTFTPRQKEFLTESTNQGRREMKLCSYCQTHYNRTMDNSSGKKVCFCLPKERAQSLAERLHERLRSTMQYGAASLENCLRDCQVCE